MKGGKAFHDVREGVVAVSIDAQEYRRAVGYAPSHPEGRIQRREA
jgi:hypothetical protein